MKLIVAFLAVALSAAAAAQPFPGKPVRMLVGFAPGGAPDILARVLGQKLGDALAQPVLVENRPGATGNIAADAVARSAPDGYTLLMATVSVAIGPSVQKLGFDPARDFEPIAMVASVPLILVTHPSVAANSVRELIELAKAQPGKLNYASVGHGSPQHLTGELFRLLGGVNVVHVPYKGGAPATQAVLTGEAQMFFAGMPPAMPHVRAGKVRALAVTSAKRSPAAPEVPTVAEAGLAGFEADNWHAILGPRGIPEDVVRRLNDEINRALALPDIRQRLSGEGAEPWIATPAETGRHLRAEMEKWAKVVKAAGIKAE
jgi:tripartite-type tricarboxylate transporter receptor subunit TctC